MTSDLLALARSPRFRHTEEKMRDALRRFVDAVWGKHHVAVFSIPALPQEDADLILEDAITELVQMRVLAERAEQEAARLKARLRELGAEVTDGADAGRQKRPSGLPSRPSARASSSRDK